VAVVVLNKDFDFWSHFSMFFTKAACVTFGGAYAVLPYVADKAVNEFGWLSTTQMVDGLALGETTPGPLIMVLAFVGFMAGYNVSGGSTWVGTAALFATVWYTFLPGFVFVLLGAPYVARIGASGRLRGMMHLVNAAVTGIILNLAYHFGGSIIKDPAGQINWAAILITAAVMILLKRKTVTIPTAVGLAALAGIIWHFVQLKAG
jgi:chromate transporter